MEIQQLVEKAEKVPMEDVTPKIEKPVDVKPDLTDKPDSWSFDDLAMNQSNPASQIYNAIDDKPKPDKKSVSGVASTKMIARLFEKILNAVCEYKHGLTLDDIGAGLNEKDINLASELAGEGMDRGELPKIPTWVSLVVLILLIFAFPTYKVLTFKPKVSRNVPNPSMMGMVNDSIPELRPDGKPYKRGKYKPRKPKS